MSSTRDEGAIDMGEYILDNAWQLARRRLARLEEQLDPGTVRHLEALGVGAGWRCLEVGGGGGSVADWLCRRVGPGGSVLATDVDTRFLEAVRAPNLEVRRHDIVAEELPGAAFDLVHARTVLNHLGRRDVALRRMAAALRPGGWLLVEEGDWISWEPDPTADAETAALFRRHWAAHDRFATARGLDHAYGRRLYGEVCRLGLVDVGAEGRVSMVRGGTPQAELWRLSFQQVGEPTVRAGLLAERDLQALLALLEDPGFVWMGMTIMAVWGRRPQPDNGQELDVPAQRVSGGHPE